MTALSAYRNFVGLAKLTTDGWLTTATAPGAVTLLVNALDGVPTNSMSVVFLDGKNTETVAVSNVTGPVSGVYTLTVGATSSAHLQGTYVYLQPTASLGPTNFIPMRTFKVPDTYDQLYDESYRGSLTKEFGVVQGMRHSEWQMEGDIFVDTFGYLLGGLFGADTVSGAASSGYTHQFSLLNTGNGQPTRYLFYVYDDVNLRVVAGRITEVGLKYDPKALITHSTKLLAFASGVVANTTQSYSALTPLPTWASVATLAGTYSRDPLTFELTLAREESENIPTITGTQDPFTTFIGPLTAKGKFSFVKEDDTFINRYEAGTLFSTVLALTQGAGASTVGLTVQMTDCNEDTDEPMLQGKAYNTEDVAFTGIANSTDAGPSGGVAPVTVSLVNAVAGSTTYV